MPAKKFYQYIKAIEPVEAHETILLLNATAYPHLDKRRRKEIFKDLKDKLSHCIKVENVKLANFADVKSTIMKAIRYGR